MTYFVTGATGFIGRHLVARLLDRDDDIYVLVRPDSTDKLNGLMDGWGPAAPERVHPVLGDLTRPQLGLGDADVARLREVGIDHFFHLAAVYDMTADDERNRIANVEGTRHAVALANALDAGTFHHTSSIAAAGEFKGLFREDMFDEGQKLSHPYHRTKFESEKIARTQTRMPWRVYRPGIVVGNSQTGVMDKIDGPYYFFTAIKMLRHYLPGWFPLIGPELGYTNIVPVDFVADAMDHIAHQPDLDNQAFHLTNPASQRVGEVMNAFAAAAHAPQMSLRIDAKLLKALPKGTIGMLMALPAAKGVRKAILADFGIPDEVIGHIALRPQFDTRDTERALKGSGIEVPPLDTYATKLWDYWERNLDPDLFKDRSFEGAVNGKRVLITGASSGIGRAAAHQDRPARAESRCWWRAPPTSSRRPSGRSRISAGPPTATPPTSPNPSRSTPWSRRCWPITPPSTCSSTTPGGRSAARWPSPMTASTTSSGRSSSTTSARSSSSWAFCPTCATAAPGHVINVSSIGVQTNPPRFSAYVASKAALDAWTRVVGSESIGDNVHFTTIHMPLVRTPMIAPTKIYDSFPTISPEEAADLICEAIRAKPKHLGTRLGTFGEVAYALAPKAVDQILSTAYKVFPDSAASKGQKDPDEHASTEQVALAHLMRGVHW